MLTIPDEKYESWIHYERDSENPLAIVTCPYCRGDGYTISFTGSYYSDEPWEKSYPCPVCNHDTLSIHAIGSHRIWDGHIGVPYTLYNGGERIVPVLDATSLTDVPKWIVDELRHNEDEIFEPLWKICEINPQFLLFVIYGNALKKISYYLSDEWMENFREWIMKGKEND